MRLKSFKHTNQVSLGGQMTKIIYQSMLRIVGLFGPLIPCLTFAQDTLYTAIDREWHQLNLDFFQENTTPIENHPYYKAIQARIEGDVSKELMELQNALDYSSEDSLKRILVKQTYGRLLTLGRVAEARKMVREYNLKVDTMDLAFKQSDYPETSIAMPEKVVELPFDQFYFKATVNGSDTVTIFFDTGAPGVAVSQKLVERYGCSTDTLYSGTSRLPALGMAFKNYPVLIPEFTIGSMKIQNLFAKYSNLTAEEERQLEEKGLNKHDILIGLDVFREMVDGVEFDYANGKIRFIKHLEENSAPPNFCFVGEVPAVSYLWNGEKKNAILDTGSPGHVMPKDQLIEGDAIFDREASYGNFTYRIYRVQYEKVLNLENPVLETADYGFPVEPDFGIYSLFGSFKTHSLFFDLRNRRVRLDSAKDEN